jgi:dipeptidyl-peptidase-4
MSPFLLMYLCVWGKEPIPFSLAYLGQGPALTKPASDQPTFLWTGQNTLLRQNEEQSEQWNLSSGSWQKSEQHPSPSFDPLPEKATDLHVRPELQARIFLLQGNLHYEGPLAPKGKTKQLTQELAEIRTPRLSPDGSRVAYTRQGALMVLEVNHPVERCLAAIESPHHLHGFASWVYYEEILGRDSHYRAFWWSPDGRHLAFFSFDETNVTTFPLYQLGGPLGTLETMRYPKAGGENPKVALGIASMEYPESPVWVTFDQQSTVWLSDHYLGTPFWSVDADVLLVQRLNRDQDHLEIYAYHLDTGSLEPLYQEHQDSWVEFWNQVLWPSNETLYFLSDRSGWRHLYRLNLPDKSVQALTSGHWQVRSLIGVAEQPSELWFHGSLSDTTTTEGLALNLKTGALRTLTPQKGTHTLTPSKDYSLFLDRFSEANTPLQIWLCDRAGQRLQLLYDARNPQAEAFAQATVHYFSLYTRDGVALPAYAFLPPQGFPEANVPLLLTIYGGPEAPTTMNRFRQRWEDHYLAQEGILIVSVDHRGAGHHGKRQGNAGVATMHRRLGDIELRDLTDAVSALKKRFPIDRNKIGIRGHSYGGYVTLLALTRGAHTFTHGVSAAPVTDWQFYDSVYTERLMDLPTDNPQGYEQASILTWADRLQGKLRLLHGTADDNVHFQNSLALIDVLTAKGLPFELSIYPGARHGIRKQGQDYTFREAAFWWQHFLYRDFYEALDQNRQTKGEP